MKKQTIETCEHELMNLYLKVRRERLKSKVPYLKTQKILIPIYNRTKEPSKWLFNF